MGKFQQLVSKTISLLFLKTSQLWETEIISNDAHLYRIVPIHLINNKTKKPSPSNFDDCELSCDWNKYATPQQTRILIGRQHKKNGQFKNPNDFFICRLIVNKIEALNIEQEIRHNPLQEIPEKIGSPNNRAHTLVLGEKGTDDHVEKENVKRSFQLAKISEWEIYNEDERNIFMERLRLSQK